MDIIEIIGEIDKFTSKLNKDQTLEFLRTLLIKIQFQEDPPIITSPRVLTNIIDNFKYDEMYEIINDEISKGNIWMGLVRVNNKRELENFSIYKKDPEFKNRDKFIESVLRTLYVRNSTTKKSLSEDKVFKIPSFIRTVSEIIEIDKKLVPEIFPNRVMNDKMITLLMNEHSSSSDKNAFPYELLDLINLIGHDKRVDELNEILYQYINEAERVNFTDFLYYALDNDVNKLLNEDTMNKLKKLDLEKQFKNGE